MNDEIGCRMLASQEFFSKVDISLKQNQDAILALLFFSLENYGAKTISKDEEERIILGSWQNFLENCSLTCFGCRLGWSSYLILVEEDKDKTIRCFRQVFNVWEKEPFPNLGRIAFTDMNDTKERRFDIMMREFDTITKNAVCYYYPFERFFEIDIDKQRAIPSF